MKTKIAILGSTGSIGKTTLNILKKNMSNFTIELLVAKNNYKKIIKQAKYFKVKNVLIYNTKYFLKLKKELKSNQTKVFCGNKPIDQILKKKVDFTISAIVGIEGLKPTIESIKCSKNVAIANKESIICGWNLISRNKNKFGTNILPIESEHFSISELSKNLKNTDIEEIVLTASGGPFLNTPLNKLKYMKSKEAIKHPNWKMGKKISVDSSTLINKVFELIEATKIFKFDASKYKIMIHPQSYVHAIIRYKNGLIKMLLHNTDMTIPISNTILGKKTKNNKVKELNTSVLDKLRFLHVDEKRYPSIRFVKKCLNSGQSSPIILNASNEILVASFLKNKIKFTDIISILNKIFRHKDFKKYAKKKTNSLVEIYKVDEWARKVTNQYI